MFQARKISAISSHLSITNLRIKALNISHRAQGLEDDIIRDMKREAKEKQKPLGMIHTGVSMGLLASRVRIR